VPLKKRTKSGIPKPTKSPYYVPVVMGRPRLDMGAYLRRRDALEQARIAVAMLPPGRAEPDAVRAWVAVEWP
jgi:hypothetical protein